MGGERSVLVLTHPFDPTADYVIAELNNRSVPVFRCNPGEFPRALTLAAVLVAGSSSQSWTGTVQTTHRVLSLGAVGCVYYRRPTRFEFGAALTRAERDWAAREARMGLGGVLSALPRWLNHPAAISRAEYKPVQLHLAATCGLTVPATLITNDGAAAQKFAREVGNVVYKPLGGAGIAEDDTYKALFTTIVDPKKIDESVSTTAHLFQQALPKAYEVRLTVVDDAMFATRIHAGSAAAAVDWRSDYQSLTYDAIDTPPPIRVGVSALMRRLDLRFGVLDFVVSPDERWWFLELNPNGQWAFVQDATGQPIAAAIADALQKE
jgi:ATP-grasp ribosomal peptide maturase